MSRQKKGRKQQQIKEFLDSICTKTDIIQELREGAISDSTFTAAKTLANHTGIKIEEISDLIRILPRLPDAEARQAYEIYHRIKLAKRRKLADTRRHFRKGLGLGRAPLGVCEMAEKFGIEVCERERVSKPCLPQGVYVNDPGLEYLQAEIGSSRPLRKTTVGNDSKWLRISPDRSIIIRNNTGAIQLVVLRNLCQNPDVLAHVNSTIVEAVEDRKDVRPTQRGKLIQMGQNAGARAPPPRIFGLVNNLLPRAKKASASEKEAKDLRIIGTFSLFWHLICAHAPAEIVAHVTTKLKESGMPEMAGRYSEGTSGYSVRIGDQDYIFPRVSRAPSEGYLAQGYISPTHRDDCWADFAFAWQTEHSQLEDKSPTGGNFVDITLQVVVESAPDTLLIFLPNFVHSTTLSVSGIKRHGLVITFSTHIKEAFDIAMERASAGKSPLD